MDLNRTYDVIVAGGGNAALCAALSAREAGATVLVLEAAPKEFRGGNSRHTRNFRCMHSAPTGTLIDAYTEEEYWEDLAGVTGGRTNETLARIVIRETANCHRWMTGHGARFQPPLEGALQLSRTNAFFLGGGKALMNAYYRAADRAGIDVEYNAEVRELIPRGGKFSSLIVAHNRSSNEVRAKSLVVASGGYQANLEWLGETWGDAAKNFLIRGTPYDTGLLLRHLMDQGAQTVGDPAQCHAVAIDARSPRFDGGIVTRVDSIPFGIVVNKHAQRFYDEGEDFWPKRYAIWGRLVAQQPDQMAYSIIDSKSMGAFMPPMFPPIQADSVRGLAQQLQLDSTTLEKTVSDFNAAVQPGEFNPTTLDSCSAPGLVPLKSHWARRLDTPPYFAYPLRPGITFTYLGLGVNQRSQVIMQDGRPVENLFAAGEIMAGNILGKGYLAGFGMALGTVFGRLAGEEAARYARS